MTYAPAYYLMHRAGRRFAASLGDGTITPSTSCSPSGRASTSASSPDLRAAGVPVTEGPPVEGTVSVYVADPFGNRVELLERGDTLRGPP